MADANNQGWKVFRPDWYNKRIIETYISSPTIDKQGDEVPVATIKEAMENYMKFGIYSYKHEEMPIGLPLAYKVKGGKIKIRVGIHNKMDMHDRVWKEIQNYGTQGASSIRGEAIDTEKVCNDRNVCHNRINDLNLWSVSWVGNTPANPEAKVTSVSVAKELTEEIETMVEKIIVKRGKQYCLLARKDRNRNVPSKRGALARPLMKRTGLSSASVISASPSLSGLTACGLTTCWRKPRKHAAVRRNRARAGRPRLGSRTVV